MQWKNAWIITRKDLDEFKHQKLVIGSIVAMPLFLGVVLPLVLFVPLITMAPMEQDMWDVDYFLETGSLPAGFSEPMINQSFEQESLTSMVITYALVKDCVISNVVFESCDIHGSVISNAVIRNSTVNGSRLWNVTLISSQGFGLEGDHILAVDSEVSFSKKKPSETAVVLPMMLNMVLMVFIIVPATLPTIIATYSIVGEKNNRSLEPLLATPTSDGEILLGKILSSFIPSMGSTLIAFIIGVTLLDVFLTPYLGYTPLPNLIWILSILLIAPTACLMSILACVIVSSKVSDVRAAQQVGGFVVMPVVALMLAVVSGFILLSPVMVLVFTGLYAILDVGLFYFAKAIFNRENILVKWK